MEQKQMKSKHLVGSILCGVLTAIGLAATVISLMGGSQGIWVIGDCSLFLLYALIIYYAVIGYKNPHGNLLKYILLMRAALSLITIQTLVPTANTIGVILRAVEIGLLCYIAGRLAKVKENMILILIVTVCLVAAIISDAVSGVATIGVVTPLVTWLDICVAYFLRYKEHREAGIADAPKQ